MGVHVDTGRLRQAMARRGLDGRELAKLAKVTPATVSHALNRGVVGLSTVRALAHVLATTPELEGADFVVAEERGVVEE
jgi:transcriptional regulator with XRE-family HTH domain